MASLLISLFFREANFMIYAAIAATLLILAQQQPAGDWRAIADAEASFGDDVAARGVPSAFTRWSASDAVVLQPDGLHLVRQVHAEKAGEVDPASTGLSWWPGMIGISASSDLGFSTGPVEFNGQRSGHYLTVWRRQEDGNLRWIYDGGSPASSVEAPSRNGDIAVLPISTPAGGQSEDSVEAAEKRLAREASVDQRSAHLNALASDGRIYVRNLPPAVGSASFPAALANWPERLQMEPMSRHEQAKSDDLAWTSGRVTWERGTETLSGLYIHIWQRRTEGWKLVYAQIAPVRSAPPVASPTT